MSRSHEAKAMITFVETLESKASEPDLADVRMGWRLSASQVIGEVVANHSRRTS
jgi:hypothetical protein